MYGDYAGITANETTGIAALGAFVLIFILIIAAITIAFVVMSIVGQWKMFNKANEEGWKAIIPIYNTITLCKLVGVTPWWLLISFVLSVMGVVPIVGTILSLAGYVSAIYFTVILGISTARSYGKSDAYGIGFIFNITSPIFYLMTGVSKTTNYVGVKPLEDPVWDWLVKTFNGNNSTTGNNVPEANISESNGKSHYCPSCGNKVEGDVKFCTSCGKEL